LRKGSQASVTVHEEREWTSFIDPQLLEMSGDTHVISLDEVQDILVDEGDMSVAEGDVGRIISILAGTHDTMCQQEELIDREQIGLAMILENVQSAEESTDVLLLPGHEFITTFSRINIVRNASIHGMSYYRDYCYEYCREYLIVAINYVK
jgi:hypothetical protein